jgi:chemotaxis family two-component system response regulator Rcp1
MFRSLTVKTQILFAEDGGSDFDLTAQAFQECGVTESLVWKKNGLTAKEYLENPSCAQKVALILADVKMPKMDGFELLVWIKSQPSLNDIPFVFFTGQSIASDLQRAKILGADAYIAKPPNFEEYVEVIESLRKYLGKTSAR